MAGKKMTGGAKPLSAKAKTAKSPFPQTKAGSKSPVKPKGSKTSKTSGRPSGPLF